MPKNKLKRIKNWWKSKPNTRNFQNQLCQKLGLKNYKPPNNLNKKDLFILVAPIFNYSFNY